VGFDASGGQLELYSSAITGEDPVPMGSVETKANFASVVWTAYTNNGAYPDGIIAGGMKDGSILLFDPSKIMKGDDAVLGVVSAKPGSGPISAMQFGPLDLHNLCAGSFNGSVSIVDCTDPTRPISKPPDPSGHHSAAEITAVAWNTAVAHIVATAAGDGSVTVWDLQNEKPWCDIRAEHAGQAVADVAWNPSQGLHLLTASADDRNPVLRVWDLGASTSVPLATLTGHSAGLFRVAWCPHDDSLLLSVGKDNRTLLWDLHTLTPVAEVPMDTLPQQQQQPSQSNPGALFASGRPGLAEQKSMRYDVRWSPFQRGVALTCSLDKKVQIHSLLALATNAGRPPAWMKPAAAVATGFGGLLLSCGKGLGSTVSIRTVREKPEFAKISETTEGELLSNQHSIIEFCKVQQDKASEPQDQAIWGFMQVVFEENARQELLEHLGFSPSEISQAADNYSDDLANGIGSMSINEKHNTGAMSPTAQQVVKNAILIGNFEAAIECCFKIGNFADALILASCSGSAEIWSTTQERFFASELSKRPYLSLVSGIMTSQLESIVENCDTENWHEILALLATYASAEEFPSLCVALGDKVREAGDESSASLCYMCALNLERTVLFWKSQLCKNSRSSFSSTNDLKALHEFVLKVATFLEAVGSSSALPPEIEDLFTKYSQALAEQGLLVTATKYCKGSSTSAVELRDRLYRSRASQRCYAVLGSAPEFPYTMVQIHQSRGQVLAQPKIQQPVAETASQNFVSHQTSQQQQSQVEQQHIQHGYGQQQRQQYSESQNDFSQQSYQPTQTQPSPTERLPPGWLALQDPASGNTYYANQQTGETTWDLPVAVPTQPIQPQYSVPQTQSASLDTSQHSQQTSQSNTSKQRATLVSKYGDGFVSSASNPDLAYQYGNVGTTNPYGDSARPGTAAAVVVGSSSQSAPVSGTLNLDQLALSNHHSSIKESLLGTAEALQGTPLNPVEKRQLPEADKAIAILVKKLARDSLSDDVVEKVYTLANALVNRDFNTAMAMQTALANAEWREHKDWLKGIKILIQLSSKKL
jgi:protein transport protein SEC31